MVLCNQKNCLHAAQTAVFCAEKHCHHIDLHLQIQLAEPSSHNL